MAKTLNTKLDIKSWDEKPYREHNDGTKFTRANVVLSGDGLDATWEALLYYRADGTSSFVGLMHATGTVDGHAGSFVVDAHGTFDGTTAAMTGTVIPGSGTGDLAQLSGKMKHESTHADYPHWPLTLTYTLD